MAPIFSIVILLSLSIYAPKASGSNFVNTACARTPEPKTCARYLSALPQSKNLTSFKGATMLSVKAFDVWAVQSRDALNKLKDPSLIKPTNTVCLKTCYTSITSGIGATIGPLVKAATIGDFVNVRKLMFNVMKGMLPCDKTCKAVSGSGDLRQVTDMSTSIIKLCRITIALAKLESGQ